MSKSRKQFEQAESRHAATGGTAWPWVACVIVVAAVWAVYGRALDAPFIFDDAGSVVTNPSITRLWPLVGDAEHPGPLNPPPYFALSGRPMVNLSLALNYHFGQLDPWGYHFLNIMLHLTSSLLVWAILRRTLRLVYFGGRYDRAAGPLALVAALVWALHPLATEAVVYVTQRTELMMAFFYLATLYSSLRYWAAASWPARDIWLCVATLACLAGMASKEVMVSAPLMVLLFERTFITGSFGKAERDSWPLYVGLACGWMLLAYLNLSGPRGDTAGFHLGVPAYAWWLTQTKVFLMYLKLACWPWPLVIHYEVPYLETLGAAWIYLVPVALLAMAALFLLGRRRPAGYVVACVFAILSPTLLVPITTEVAAERRMYLPLAAIVALVVVGGYSLLRWAAVHLASDKNAAALGRPSAAAVVLAAVLVVACGVASAGRLSAYHDEVTLWQDAVLHQPDDAIVRHNLGVALFAARHPDEAIEQYREAVLLKPNFLEARYNLGLALFQAGQLEEAIQQFQEAVQLKPGAYKIHNNLGVALFTAGRLSEAIVEFQTTLKLKPDLDEAHDNLARALDQVAKASAKQ